MKKIFFDAHMHAMNLSHPSLGALIERFITSKVKSVKFLKYILVVLAAVMFVKLLPWALALPLTSLLLLLSIRQFLRFVETSKVRNFLNIMDTPTGEYFRAIERDLIYLSCKNGDEELIEIGKVTYDKVAISPLMMEFTGSRKEDQMQHYKTFDKDIKEQTVDLINGIKYYHEHTKHHLLRIYPFMGVTVNKDTYKNDASKNESVTIKLEELFDKYFLHWPLENSIEKLNNKHKNFKGDIDELDNCTFSGIKVYPPLGFDPWPDKKKCPDEFLRVNYLFRTCEERQIPIITHCGGEGFKTVTDEEYQEFTNPKKWRDVLNEYPNLKICFGHFGLELSTPLSNSWTETIVELILDEDYKNVYADISNRGISKKSYNQLDKRIRKLAKYKSDEVYKRILFGTDFPMNLLKNKSYDEYIAAFSNAEIDQDIKNLMCEENPRRFIFGE